MSVMSRSYESMLLIVRPARHRGQLLRLPCLCLSFNSEGSIYHTIHTGCVKFAFFFQAEDGIRDSSVTGVQTCALPIWVSPVASSTSLNWLLVPMPHRSGCAWKVRRMHASCPRERCSGA